MGLLDHLTGQDQVDAINRKVEQDYLTARSDLGRGAADAIGALTGSIAGIGASKAEQMGILGSAGAAAAQDLRDQSAQTLGAMLAQSGGSITNLPMLMASQQRQTVKGLQQLYSAMGRERVGVSQAASGATAAAQAKIADVHMREGEGLAEAASSKEYELAKSPLEVMGQVAGMMGGIATGGGLTGIFGNLWSGTQ